MRRWTPGSQETREAACSSGRHHRKDKTDIRKRKFGCNLFSIEVN